MPDMVSISKDPGRPPSPCLASHTAMTSFSELANLSADVVAKVEDSKKARPAMRPYSGHRSNCDRPGTCTPALSGGSGQGHACSPVLPFSTTLRGRTDRSSPSCPHLSPSQQSTLALLAPSLSGTRCRVRRSSTTSSRTRTNTPPRRGSERGTVRPKTQPLAGL